MKLAAPELATVAHKMLPLAEEARTVANRLIPAAGHSLGSAPTVAQAASHVPSLLNNPRFHDDPNIPVNYRTLVQEIRTRRGTRPRPEVAVPVGGHMSPAQENELHARLYDAPHNPNMPTTMRLFNTADFGKNPERMASNVADYRTMQHIQSARQRNQAIPTPILPKIAGAIYAMRLYGAL